MKKIANRIKDVEFSALLKVGEVIAKLKQAGSEVLAFNIGEPDFNTPQHIIKTAQQALQDGFTHYTASRGIPELREAVAKISKDENKIPCGPENVIITPTKFGLYSAIQATIDPGDEVMVPDPGWVSYEPMIKLAEGKPVNVPTHNEDEFRMLPENVMEALTHRSKMIIINTPSNPTGTVFTKDDIKGLADIANDHDLLVLADEIYEKIIYEGEHYSIAAEDGMFERTITVNGFSKAYAMTGWRLGWVVAPKDILDQVAKLQQHSITCCTSFAQKGGVAALTESSGCIDDMVNEFKARRDLVVDGLNEIDRLSCFRPKGAFYAFFRFDFEMTSEQFTNYVLEKGKVVLTPGSAFGKCGEGFVRFSYAAAQDKLEKGLKILAEVVAQI